MVWTTNRNTGDRRISIAPGDFVYWQNHNRAFDDIAAMHYASYTLTGGDIPERVSSGTASANFFTVLGIDAMLGRTFLPHEQQPGSANVVVLSHGFWQSYFGADREIIGRTLKLDGKDHTVVGVLPPTFRFTYSSDVRLWVPLAFDPEALARHGMGSLRIIGRMKETTSVDQAQADVEAIAGRLAAEFPKTNSDLGINVSPLREEIIGKNRPVVIMLFAASGFVLLIVCANLANLLITGSLGRQKEIAIRAAIGAGRGRIIQQLLTENILLSLLGGLAALLLAWWGSRLIIPFIPEDFPFSNYIAVDEWVFVFTFAVALMTGLVFGLIPAITVSKPDLNRSMKSEVGIAGTGFGMRGFRNALIVFEIGLTLTLVIGASLILTSVFRLQTLDLGFDVENRVTMKLSLSRDKYPKASQHAGIFSQVIEEARSLPGVQNAATIMPLPLEGSAFMNPFSIVRHIITGLAPVTFRPWEFVCSPAACLRNRTVPIRSLSLSSTRAWHASSGPMGILLAIVYCLIRKSSL